MALLTAILIGMGLTVQTGVNARLKQRVGTSLGSALISFILGTVFLLVLILGVEHSLYMPLGDMAAEPFWIWLGGIFGVIYLTGNILMMPRLGSVQTAIFPVFGQVIMGLLADSFGLFGSDRIDPSAMRFIGAAVVLAGVLIVTVPGSGAELSAGTGRDRSHRAGLWLWRIAGIGTGMLSASQTAVNGYLGRTIDSSLKASLISFVVGTIFLLVLNLFFHKGFHLKNTDGQKFQWWIWTGGPIGGLFVFGSAWLSGVLGVGLTVVITLIGISVGGVIVDGLGLFGAEKKPVTVIKLAGLAVMVAGGAMVYLM